LDILAIRHLWVASIYIKRHTKDCYYSGGRHPDLKWSREFQNESSVVAKPEIAVRITKDGQLIDTSTHDETGIKPNSLLRRK